MKRWLIILTLTLAAAATLATGDNNVTDTLPQISVAKISQHNGNAPKPGDIPLLVTTTLSAAELALPEQTTGKHSDNAAAAARTTTTDPHTNSRTPEAIQRAAQRFGGRSVDRYVYALRKIII